MEQKKNKQIIEDREALLEKVFLITKKCDDYVEQLQTS